ncbi:hypothetical protein L596_001285 [Steinernema carpocapsae]|uniref:AMP-binding enzyme C-terminal domain-containing protein n=1 Tax=Steinernema carpocapsae TaxID=34508 RepID=A0A4U8UPV0_STECR|nr:hypothetical protein L596_001285 [Steinernema carpocapsae]
MSKLQDFIEKCQTRDKNHSVYGLTEVGILCLMSPLHPKPHTTGVLLPGFESRVVADELWFRSATAMSGYLEAAQTREALTDDGWIRSGDLGLVDEEGYFCITGRLKELIKVRGWQVSPQELEDAVLAAFPDAVQECCVIGVPDKRSGEVPRAFLVLKEGKRLEVDRIHQTINRKFISYKHLTGGVEFIDRIPKNLSGKVDRRELLATQVYKLDTENPVFQEVEEAYQEEIPSKPMNAGRSA